ncbi:MAG: hypothetical protein ABL986_22350, partial [Vicinamibacterales bacterium]
MAFNQWSNRMTTTQAKQDQPVLDSNRYIWTVDLDPIKIKLMDPTDGVGWSRAKAEEVDVEYRRFLKLNLDHKPGAPPIVPTKDVDTFWHFHILDTMKYAEDCGAMFGRFLHHFPYFGLRGEEDKRNLSEAVSATKLAYRKAFGEAASGGETASCQAGC